MDGRTDGRRRLSAGGRIGGAAYTVPDDRWTGEQKDGRTNWRMDVTFGLVRGRMTGREHGQTGKRSVSTERVARGRPGQTSEGQAAARQAELNDGLTDNRRQTTSTRHPLSHPSHDTQF